MIFNPEVTVAAVVERQGRFLVVEERINGRLVINQPAGHLEDGETLLEGVIRETREETAWAFTPESLVGTYLWRSPESGRTFLRFAFCGGVSDHRPEQPLDVGIVRAHWFSRDQLFAQSPRLRSPMVLRCVEDFVAGRRYALDSVAHLGLEDAASVGSVVNL